MLRFLCFGAWENATQLVLRVTGEIEFRLGQQVATCVVVEERPMASGAKIRPALWQSSNFTDPNEAILQACK